MVVGLVRLSVGPIACFLLVGCISFLRSAGFVAVFSSAHLTSSIITFAPLYCTPGLPFYREDVCYGRGCASAFGESIFGTMRGFLSTKFVVFFAPNRRWGLVINHSLHFQRGSPRARSLRKDLVHAPLTVSFFLADGEK